MENAQNEVLVGRAIYGQCQLTQNPEKKEDKNGVPMFLLTHGGITSVVRQDFKDLWDAGDLQELTLTKGKEVVNGEDEQGNPKTTTVNRMVVSGMLTKEQAAKFDDYEDERTATRRINQALVAQKLKAAGIEEDL